ncbi:MAG: hypothetical protein ABEH88_13025 [Halobacteriales archaeon]
MTVTLSSPYSKASSDGVRLLVEPVSEHSSLTRRLGVDRVLGIYFLLKSLGYSLLIPYGMLVEPVAMLAGVSLAFIVLMTVTIRLEEMAADLHALQDLCEDGFLDAYDEISDEGSDSLHNRVIAALLYPRLNNVIRVHRFLTWAKTLSPA